MMSLELRDLERCSCVIKVAAPRGINRVQLINGVQNNAGAAHCLTACAVALKKASSSALPKCSYIRSVHYSCHASQYLISAELHLLQAPSVHNI